LSEAPLEPERSQDRPEGRRVSRGRAQRSCQNRVTIYMLILFAAAFLLLLMAFLMQHRANRETIDDLTNSMEQSMTSIHSLQNLVDSNTSLQAQVKELEEELKALEKNYQDEIQAHQQSVYSGIAAAEERDKAKQALDAMDWFWQVNEAYVRGRYSLCRRLIDTMEEQKLAQFLPEDSVTDNGRFSPAGRYKEIYDALY